MRALLYFRVSSDEQAVHGHSIEYQKRECHLLARKMGASESVEFVDAGVSGAVLDRPALDALRAAVRRGEGDLVIAYDPDRLARRLSHQLIVTEELESRCQLAYVNFRREATPEGQLFYQMRGAIAEYEREKIRERTMAGRRQKAREGKLPFAMEPYGYRYDKKTAMLEILPGEAEIVKTIFQTYAAGRGGLGALARWLDERGTPTRKGGPWHRQTIRQMLTNPVYKGVYYANRHDMSGVGLNRYRKSGKIWGTIRPAREWIPVPVPGIVVPSLWEEVQEILGRGQHLSRRGRSPYLLSGLVRCRACGKSMTGTVRARLGQKVRHYTCRRPDQGAGDPGCPRYEQAGPLEDAVWNQVGTLVWDPGSLHQVMSRSALQDDGGTQSISQELEQVRRRRRRILLVLEGDLAPPGDALESLARLKGLEEELLKRKRRCNDDVLPTLEDARDTLRGALREMEIEDRRQVLRQFVAEVWVGSKEILVRARVPGMTDLSCHPQGDSDAPEIDQEAET